MKRGFLAALAFTAANAVAATTTTVVDIPAAEGGTQRFLWVRPDAPIATIVNLPGGTGVYAFQDDGTTTTEVGQCSPPYRTRADFAARGIAMVLVDATSTGATYNLNDTLAVIRHVRSRDNVPVWISGGSASTAATAFAAASLPDDIPAGAMFFSPARPTSAVSTIRRPSLVVYHTGDTEAFGNLLYNALTSAPVRERVAISGGSNAGCGYHLFNGTEAQLVEAAAGFIVRHNAATAIAAPNYQGLWYGGEAESGWGVNVAHQGDIFFVTWFTYDADGSQMWLVAPDVRRDAGGTFTGALFRTTGPPFDTMPFDPARLGLTQVGTVSFAFSDANNGRFSYTFGGVSQSKPIVRQVFGPLPTCTAGGTHGTPFNVQDLWYAGESERGWGVNLTQQGDIVFATWFTYDAAGRGMWIVAPRMERTTGNAFAGALYRTAGPAFSAQPWTAITVTQVGTATLAFDSAASGVFTYTVGGVSQARPIVRQVFGSPATVCR